MTRLVRLDKHYWPRGGYGHWCPGCNNAHEIDTEEPNGVGAKWSFNGDLKSPTFSPSINMKINPKGHKHYQPDIESTICHYFIRAGRIEFCGDSTHALAGQTVDLPEIPSGHYLTCERL